MSWEPGVSAERRARPRRRRRAEDRETLRRLTLGTAVAAAGLNAALFLALGISELGPGGVDAAIISAVAGLLPGGRLQPSAAAPSPAPGQTPVLTSGGS